MPNSEISLHEFTSLVRPLIGMLVSLPWNGYGSAIFLELGDLAPLGGERRNHNKGEACIEFYWDWRVEDGFQILYGSSNSRPKTEGGLAELQGTRIESITIKGHVRELTITFSNGRRLKSMAMVSGDPQWSIRLPDATRVFSEAGLLFVGDGRSAGLTKEEEAVFALAETTARRWGLQVAEPKAGNCRDCRSYVRVDGHGHLLDFGVCIEAASPFDGRAVNCNSGCPAFSNR